MKMNFYTKPASSPVTHNPGEDEFYQRAERLTDTKNGMTRDQLLNGDSLPDQLRRSTFLIVGYGECYDTNQVEGRHLVRRVMVMVAGDDSSIWSDEEIRQWAKDLSDPENWSHDADFGPTMFTQDLGEIDHLEIFRLRLL